MKKYILVLMAMVVGCSANVEDTDPGENQNLRVVLSRETVTPDQLGLVEMGITFEGLSNSASLVVTQKGGRWEKDIKYGTGVLSEEFVFQYAVQPDDPEEIVFAFQLNGKDGRPGPVSELTVDKRGSASGM